MTATELSRRYVVGLDRLLEYSRRGNLPMSHGSDGTPVFDEDIVVRLFRSRSAAPAAVGSSLAVLGSSRLGAPATPEVSSRETRRREIWRERRDVGPGAELAAHRSKTG